MRTWYDTDVDDADPNYIGIYSAVIPASAFRDGHIIVDVDWSERGKVQVTYLVNVP
jgi:hypothetical protein